jgi:hypothetical protein
MCTVIRELTASEVETVRPDIRVMQFHSPTLDAEEEDLTAVACAGTITSAATFIRTSIRFLMRFDGDSLEAALKPREFKKWRNKHKGIDYTNRGTKFVLAKASNGVVFIPVCECPDGTTRHLYVAGLGASGE